MNDPIGSQEVEARFFEGTEKKVELVIDDALPSLRGFGDEYWARIARCCGARILSTISSESCDAHLLSESSLFVFDHKMIMITCGRTTLPEAVIELLRRVRPEEIELFIYERKNEVYPRHQPTSFYDDVKRLDELLPGRAFRFGDEDEHHVLLFHLDRPYRCPERDLTVEILMHGIDDATRASFDAADTQGSTMLRQRAQLEKILPGFRIDDHLFRPSGYSLNALRDDMYWTLHVTPERNGSYVSFETNYRVDGKLESIAGPLLELFRPRSFDLVAFHQGERLEFEPERYRVKSHVAQELSCGYEVRFMSFFRPQAGVRSPLELPIR